MLLFPSDFDNRNLKFRIYYLTIQNSSFKLKRVTFLYETKNLNKNQIVKEKKEFHVLLRICLS